MPGVDLNITYPLATEALSTAIPKLITALQTIETDVEAKVVPAEIDVNANLDFNGYRVVDAGVVTLTTAPDTTGYPAGTAIYSGGEWFLSTSSGVVQVTTGGGLNAAAIGGIVGDYGGANPARVTFVDASSVYRFTEDTNNWADVEAEDLILHGSSTGTVTLTTNLTANKTITVTGATHPASNTSLLGITAAGSLVAFDGTVDVTNAISFNNANITLEGTAEIKHPDRVRTFMPRLHTGVGADTVHNFQPVTGGVEHTQSGAGAGAGLFVIDIDGWENGDRLKTLTFARKGANATDDLTVDFVRVTSLITVTETSLGGTPTNITDIGTSWGWTVLDFTDETVTATAGDAFRLYVNSTVEGLTVGGVNVTYDHP